MHRVDGAGVAEDVNGVGKDGFTIGDPGGSVPATTITADILNAVQEEICNLIESLGITLVKADNTQLLTAITQLVEDAAELVAESIVRGVDLGVISLNGKTSEDFIDIPSGVERVEIWGRSVSFVNGGNDVCLRLGNASSFITTGYNGSTREDGAGGDAWGTQANITRSYAHDRSCAFHVFLEKEPSSNIWHISATASRDDGSVNNVMIGNGWVDVGATLTRLRIRTEAGSFAFDGGFCFAKYW